MDAKFRARVSKFAEGLLERSLQDDEQTKLDTFITQNIKYLENQRKTVQVAELANEFVIMNIKLADETQISADVRQGEKEYLKHDDLNLSAVLNIDTFDRFISAFNPQAKKRIAYMCCDSRYAKYNEQCTKLTWNFSNTLNAIYNSTNVIGDVRDVTQIRMQSMTVRKFASVPKRATVLIEELRGQSFIMPSGRRFHFVCSLEDLQNPISFGDRAAVVGQSVPDVTVFDKYDLRAGKEFNDGIYRFNVPITSLDEITISIGNPDTLVVLPKYQFDNVTVITKDPLYVDLELNEPHNYTANNSAYSYAAGTFYSVFVDGFDSTDTGYNDWMNSHEFTRIEILTDTRIRILFEDAPAGGVYNPFPPTLYAVISGVPTVYVGVPVIPPYIPTAPPITAQRVRFNSYRIIMNFEIEYITQ